MNTKLFICLIFISFAFADNMFFESAKVKFTLPCEKLCEEDVVAEFIAEIQDLTGPLTSIHLVHIWGNEVTLLICGSNISVTHVLNTVESNEEEFAGVSVGEISWGETQCALYNSNQVLIDESSGCGLVETTLFGSLFVGILSII